MYDGVSDDLVGFVYICGCWVLGELLLNVCGEVSPVGFVVIGEGMFEVSFFGV